MNSEFIEINGDIFNVDRIQSLRYEDQKNCLGNNNGVYILHIYMENDVGSQHKAYSARKERDEDFLRAKQQLMRVRKMQKGYDCK